MKQERLRGFTLIELLFVIAIMAVIATIAVSTYQKRTETAKIDKAALQIQQIMQAAMAYHADHQCWPNNDNSGECTPGKTRPNFGPYLPTGSAVSPWDNESYTYGAKGVAPPNDRLFQVSVKVNDVNTGARLKALLPNATYDAAGQNMLQAEIAPAPGSAPTGIVLKGIGAVTLDDGRTQTLNAFQCPAGDTPQVFTAINTIDVKPVTYNALGIVSAASQLTQARGTVALLGNNQGEATIGVANRSNWRLPSSQGGGEIGDNGKLTVVYLEVCVPQ